MSRHQPVAVTNFPMDFARGNEVASAPPGTDSSEAAVCVLCGESQRNGICHRCAFRLLDLGVSTAEQPLPEPGDQPVASGSQTGGLQWRYGHYQVCESAPGVRWELGRGSMGITYKAVDVNLGNFVALKVLNNVHLTRASHTRFSREAKSAAQLSHANIARVFHLGEQSGESFYVMEFVEGETLDTFIRRKGTLPWQVALSIVRQCAMALRVAHSRGFIHRDIKPSNIMLSGGEHTTEEDLTVKIIDFGLVKTAFDDGVQDAISLAYFAGTPCYASPEQWESKPVDGRTDIYSLGICFSYMLTGIQPQVTASSVDGIRRYRPAPQPTTRSLASVPEPAALLLRAMTASDAALRPQSTVELLGQIQHCLTSVRPAGDPNTDRTGRRAGTRWLLPVLGALILALAALLATRAAKDPANSESARQQEAQQRNARREARAKYEQAEEFRGKLTKADNQRAIKLYTDALLRVPDFAAASAGLSIAKYQSVARFGAPKSDMDSAVAYARDAITADPKLSGGYHALAAIRSLQGRPWQALAELRHALELDPKNVPVIRDFSLLWCSVGRPHFALAWAKTAARLQPADIRALTAIADASIDLCDDEQARDCYRRCLEIKPIWMGARCGAIHIDILEGDFTRAREDYAVARSINAEAIFPLTLKAQIDLFSGDDSAAEAAYRTLLTMDREGMVRYYGGISYLSALGFLRYRAGDAEEGEKLLDEASKLYLGNSDGPQSVYDLAAIRAIQGRTTDALALLRQAIASGWVDYRVTRLDPRFAALRNDPQFAKIIEDLSNHVGQMRAEAERLCAKPLNLADYPVAATDD